jgi:SAM-dependent methyltransferase
MVTMLRRALGTLKGQLDYRRYVWAQVRQSRAKRRKDASFRIGPFIRVIKDHCRDLTRGASILCIGARNEVEVNIFEREGFPRVTAIDLWSTLPKIRRMDMHALAFPDNSFDLIFASHVFEHAYDFPRVAKECVRTLRSGGYLFCAFPTGFQVNEHDRIDFGDAQGLLKCFEPFGAELLYENRYLTEVSLLLRVWKG